jgi:hypothetical protein
LIGSIFAKSAKGYLSNWLCSEKKEMLDSFQEMGVFVSPTTIVLPPDFEVNRAKVFNCIEGE